MPPWQKGQSGHPGGRRVSDKPFLKALNMEIAAAGENHKALREIAANVLKMAKEGDMRAVEFVADRLDGKPVQKTDVDVTLTDLRPEERFKRIIEIQAQVVGQETASPAPSELPRLQKLNGASNA
jgi:hypothetical protein